MEIAVDVDGVLADQIAAIIPRLRQRYGIVIDPDEITSWAHPLSCGTDICQEIEEALRDPQFLLGMPVVQGAVRGMSELCKTHKVCVATGRHPALKELTARWLRMHGIPYARLVSTYHSGKVALRAQVLIDDNVGNVVSFCQTGRYGVLFNRAWNRHVGRLDRLFRARDWSHVVEIVKGIERA